MAEFDTIKLIGVTHSPQTGLSSFIFELNGEDKWISLPDAVLYQLIIKHAAKVSGENGSNIQKYLTTFANTHFPLLGVQGEKNHHEAQQDCQQPEKISSPLLLSQNNPDCQKNR